MKIEIEVDGIIRIATMEWWANYFPVLKTTELSDDAPDDVYELLRLIRSSSLSLKSTKP